MAEIIGQTIGNYRIGARLGGGGMGVVYSAEDTRLGRPVAVKFLSEEMARHPQALERFEREARAASALNHPNIATVYDVGEHEGRPYLVMELVEGQALDQRLRERAPDIATLVDWAIQIADALDAAHAKGIVHRDVKPANLLVNARGQIKVLDFGLAKVAEPHAGAAEAAQLSAGPTVDDLLTSPGVAVGTVSYMSPEQARGEELDARSDLFSLGCVLYEMATGHRAFTGKTPAVVFHAILERTPAPVREANPALPAKLEEIIAKALEKERDLRYQTAAELRGDLRRLKRELDLGRGAAPGASGSTTAVAAAPRTPPAPTPSAGVPAAYGPVLLPEEAPPNLWKRMLTPGGIARVVVLALAAVLGYRVLISGGHAPALKIVPGSEPAAPFSSFQVTRLTTSQAVFGEAISRDGKYLAYISASGALQEGIAIQQIATRSTVQLVAPQPSELGSLAFSPDGSFVYYAMKGAEKGASFYQIPSLGGAARLVAAGALSNVALSFDGNHIAYVGIFPGDSQASLLVAGIGEKAEAPRAVIRNVDASTLDQLAWSPDGQRLALVESRPDPSGLYARVMTVSTAGGALQPLGTMRWRGASGGLAWLPDGSGLLLNAQERTGTPEQVWNVSYPAGAARQITSDLSSHQYSLSITADGKAFVDIQADSVSNLWIAPKGEEKSAKRITTGRSDGEFGMAWTPDGNIVYVSDVTGSWQLWLTDPAGQSPRQLTTDASYHVWPTVCAGTGRVFYASDASGGFQLWSAGLEDGKVRQQSSGEEQFSNPDCSPDGTWLAGLESAKDAPFARGKLARMERESGAMRTLFDGDSEIPKISPDGKRVAFLYHPAAQPGAPTPAPRIGIASASGGLEKSFEVQASALAIPNIRWTPNGKGVVYMEHHAGATNLWVQPLGGGRPKQLTHFSEGLIFNFEWSRDGKFLALARGSYSNDAVLFTSTQ